MLSGVEDAILNEGYWSWKAYKRSRCCRQVPESHITRKRKVMEKVRPCIGGATALRAAGLGKWQPPPWGRMVPARATISTGPSRDCVCLFWIPKVSCLRGWTSEKVLVFLSVVQKCRALHHCVTLQAVCAKVSALLCRMAVSLLALMLWVGESRAPMTGAFDGSMILNQLRGNMPENTPNVLQVRDWEMWSWDPFGKLQTAVIQKELKVEFDALLPNNVCCCDLYLKHIESWIMICTLTECLPAIIV